MAEQKTTRAPAQTKACPEGYHSLNTFIVCSNAKREVDFLIEALGARERSRLVDPETKRIAHIELQIGDSMLMLADPISSAGMGSRPRQELGGSPASFYLYVENADTTFARATKAGAKAIKPVQDMFWGDRGGTFECPEGFHWTVATHVRDLTPAEIAAGFAGLKKQLAATASK